MQDNAGTWDITLSEISQKNKYMFSFICGNCKKIFNELKVEKGLLG
jgi:hypothetical protein